MAFNAFLEIQGIKGDSTDSKHKDWVAVESYSHKMSMPVGGTRNAHGVNVTGGADHEDFVIVKRLDVASPLLAEHCCSGKNIPQAKLELCRESGNKETFMVYTFKNLVVSSVKPLGSLDDKNPLPLEEISLRYSEINWEYTTITDKGRGASVKRGWSTLESKLIS